MIHTLETISLLLVFIMLFQIRKHYILFSNLELPTKHTASKTKTVPSPSLNINNQNQSSSKYYGHKLPELEVSISSDQDIASFTNTPFIKNLALNKKTTKKVSVQNSVTKKKKNKLAPEPRPTHKEVLNNYIDDFFSAPPQAEIQQPDFLPFLDRQITSPANDEIITVNEPTEMI